MAPRILLSATLRWPIAARLAVAFAKLGSRVEAVCPDEHPLVGTGVVRKIYTYKILRPLTSLRAAIRGARPELIVPCDDDAALALHRLHESTSATQDPARIQRAIIERSLGSPAACTLATTRSRLLALAAQEGVRVPKTSSVGAAVELSAWLERRGFPAVIKIDGTWGGQGVSIVRNHEEALRAYQMKTAAIPELRAVLRMLVERDSSALLKRLKSARPRITVQDFIPGLHANRAVACWDGEVLAGISVAALRTQHPTGTATVVRVLEIPEMAQAAQRLVKRLGLSGFWGLDFILEAKTGAAYFIEMNPRATPICHLALGTGRDLPAALYARLLNTVPAAGAAVTDQNVIALFPGEWQRNPSSAYLRSAYHDIPWEEPALVQDGI